MAAPYPAHREADVALRDGSTVRVRPVKPDDEGPLAAFLREGLSERSRYMRFFSGGANLERTARAMADVDYERRFGLVATAGPERRMVAHAGWVRAGGERAEVAFEVADAYQGRGLGTILLAHLAEAAAERGIAVFEATVLPENHRMVEVFRDSGFSVRTRAEPGLIIVEFPTSLTPETIERFERREQTAAVAAMRTLLSPRSVAVIGASRERGTIGGEVFHNLLATGFNGPVSPVNPKAEVVQSVAAYPTIGDVPGSVDLAVVVVVASIVVDVARQCAQKGVRSLVVISAGFGETGEEGRQRQRELLTVCREAGMRLIGPNCMGILNAAPDVRFNATFAPVFPPHGRVGFLSQSGALGLAVIDHASALGLGISTFVSIGNKADLSGNDLIHYWEADDDTDLILLYLESFGNPRKFARIARRVGRHKPIVVVKSGRTVAGVRATGSHTGALLAASDVTVDALFAQAGVIRTDTLEEMFDVASLLANQPPPRGKRIVIFIPPLVTRAEDVARAIRAAADEVPRHVTLLSVFMSARGLPRELGSGIPSYAYPEDAARAVAHAARYGAWRETPEGTVPSFADARRGEAAAVLAEALAGGPRWLRPDEVARLLAGYGLPKAEWRLVPTPAAAGRAAEELGGPVALKAVAPTLVHKSDVGGVQLRLSGAEKVRDAARRMKARVEGAGHPLEGFLVQRMAPPGVEMLVGVVHDRLFGPVVACGAGGVAAELLKDVRVGITPLTDRDADEMVRSLATYPLLDGYRGAPRADVGALRDVLLRVGALVEDHGEVAEMDCNPVVVSSEGAVIVDARVRVEAPPLRLPIAARRP